MLLPLVSLAAASGGAFVVGPATTSLYAGVDAERITRLRGGSSAGDPQVSDVDQGLSKLTAKAILSYGLAPRTELELTLPWGYNHANRTDGPLCTALGDGCKTTSGIGVVEAKAKFLVLDELTGAPLSVAAGVETRFGQLTWATRDRITNLGEGTSDVGSMLAVGRSGGLGQGGYWAANMSAAARYRFPNTDAGGVAVPGWETDGNAEVLLTPTGRWSIGPDVAWFFRPDGIDIETADPTDPDWLASLRVSKVAVGGSVHLRAREGVVFSGGVLRNVWSVNNPADALLVSVGLQVNRLGRVER